ncbi:tyrosine-type recombinase/integrase [Streptomyces sp. NPDC051218]|uniref:tyrosine-type recombinase/integrase n=1 Tax=Streptomyces sp. NPDC051218 TaxID=3365645 RepID=UPI0037970E98
MTTFAQWTKTWSASLEVGPNTAAGYQSLLKNHLLPAWGDMPLDEITPTAVITWLKQLRVRYKPTTVAAIGKLLSLILSAAVLERLIPVNPVRIPRQRGRTRREEAAWCDEYHVLDIARRITHLGSPNLGLLIITAAYTGMRWGELTGLRRDAVDLDAATLSVHPDHGALHEINGHHSYGPPKTAASVRTVTLPPFLTTLLTQDLATHRRDHVFTSVTGKLLRRSTTQRRYWAPAVSGCTFPDDTVWKPIKPGLTFHGLRHSHKTWLIEDNIPDVAQARRLGHTMNNEIDDIYSHVAHKINTRILNLLEDRWQRSLKRGRGGSRRL